ncbi:MAG: ATP-binding protein [SAR324 cluster bacterium]|nr:ATP-binding protein [SAR324 cluster bacterium]
MASRKFFNTAGPCQPEDHYMVNFQPKFENILQLIDTKKYFILHAPRQTGKTTMMIQLAEQINREDQYVALYLNVESAQAYFDDVRAVNNSIISEFRIKSMVFLPKQYQPSAECYRPEAEFSDFLTRWCLELPKPLVLFMDEVDSLIGHGLISVLRQLRSGYSMRPKGFPHSICLIGLRDLRDYRLYDGDGKKYVVGGSAFNIKDKSLTLSNFTLEQVKELYAQHTVAMGQSFTEEALQLIYTQTGGQPWLVNALGRELCFEAQKVPWNQMVTPEDVYNACEILILRRDVHLDQLADKLSEPRVSKIIEKILVGEQAELFESTEEDRSAWNEDERYVLDLGLVKRGRTGLEISNPIYREVVPRELTWGLQEYLGQDRMWYVKPDGKLDVALMLERYIEFYKEHSEMITKRKTYTEAAHHLLFMAWLQRIVNGGGRITREYAIGLKRLDLLIEFVGERFAFELKLSGKKALVEGTQQLTEYLTRLNMNFGTLIIFSRKPPEDMETVGKREMIEQEGKQIELIWL